MKDLAKIEHLTAAMETTMGMHSVIPMNDDYEARIFNSRNIDLECDYIANLMWNEVDVIKQLLDDGQYMEAAMKFMQITKSMCRHFVLDEHYCYFDDLYCPEFVIDDLIKLFNGLARDGRLPDDVKAFLRTAWTEITLTECYKDYGTPRNDLLM